MSNNGVLDKMTSTNATIGNTSGQVYNTHSGSSKQTKDISDVLFADVMYAEVKTDKAAYESNYDKTAKDSSVKDKQNNDIKKTEKSDSQQSEKTDDNQPVDDVEKTDDQPKTEETKADNTDKKEGKSDDTSSKDESEGDEDSALDALAGQPESLTNKQQAMDAIAVFDINTGSEEVSDDQELDIDLDIDAAFESGKKDEKLNLNTEKQENKAGENKINLNLDSSVQNDEKVSNTDSDKVQKQNTATNIDIQVDDQVSDVDSDALQEETLDVNKEQVDTQQTKSEIQLSEVKEETVVNVKTEEVRVDDTGKEKKINYKDFKQDYYSVQDNASQQSTNFSGMNNKDSNQDKGYDRGENLSKISFISSTSEDNKNIQQTLGVDKASEKIDIDSAKNVDNIVKTVKTMVSNNNSTMVIRLDPPELGEMRINIRSNSDGMTIEIQAANAKSQQMLQQSSGQLRSALENSGIHVNNVDVQFKPDMKNNANAGSDFQDDQSNMFDQNNNQNMPNSGQNPDETFQQNFNSWSSGTEFEDAEFATIDNIETDNVVSEQWQEISFDAVNVLI